LIFVVVISGVVVVDFVVVVVDFVVVVEDFVVVGVSVARLVETFDMVVLSMLSPELFTDSCSKKSVFFSTATVVPLFSDSLFRDLESGDIVVVTSFKVSGTSKL